MKEKIFYNNWMVKKEKKEINAGEVELQIYSVEKHENE